MSQFNRHITNVRISLDASRSEMAPLDLQIMNGSSGRDTDVVGAGPTGLVLALWRSSEAVPSSPG